MADPQLTLDANISPLRQKLREAASELNRFGTDGKKSVDGLGGAFDGLASRAAGALTGILSLGAMAGFVKSSKDAVTQAEASFRGLEAVANYAGVGIGRAMEAAGKLAADGLMTTAEASKALQNLLSRGYTLDQAVATLTRLKDAAAFNRAAHLSMGEAVVTATEGLKNENSVLVDNAGVTKNVSKMWEEYAAQLGKSTKDLTQAEKIQAEYNGVMRETEAQVGNAAKASDGLQGKTAKLSSAVLDLKIKVGEALTPAFEMLASIASWVIGKFDTFLRLIQISAAQIGKWGADVGAVFNAVSNWDFSKLRSQLDQNAAVLSDMVDDIMTAQAGSSFKTGTDSGVRRDPASLEGGGGGTATKEKKKKTDGPVDVFDNGSFVTGDKGVVDFIRKQFDAVNDLQGEMVKEAEKAAEKIAATDKKAAAEFLQLSLLRASAARDEALYRVNEAEAAAQHEFEMGQLTQAQLLDLKTQFNQRRLDLEQQFVSTKRELALQDPDQNPVELERIEMEKLEIKRRYAAQAADLQRQQSIESQSIWRSLTDSISGLWDKGVQALMNGTLTWKNAMQAIGAEVVRWFATKVVGDMVKEWVAGQMKKLAALLGFTTAEKGIHAASTAATVATKTAETTAVVGANAAQAGSGAAASQASIPFVGPILALAAMAAVFAAVMAMGKKGKSAARGYDIPKGINPMTQLHAEEMVLPAHLANPFRKMVANGGAAESESGAMRPVQVNITSHNARGVRELFMDNPDILAEAIRKAVRNGFR